MSHIVDLTANVPLYGQESCIWCGAATAQMIMDGYPNPSDRIFFTQTNIWNTIQANNSTDPADAAWATDPIGIRDTMMAMNHPPAGTWVLHSQPSRDQVMFSILYWMNRNHFPVAVLINQGGHWVAIVGYETDIEPLSGTTPTLDQITYNDPEPHNVGTTITKTGNTWYAAEWNGPVRFSGSWYNDYVAVIEPPEEGKVRVKEVDRIGERIISPREATRFAQNAIRELALNKKKVYGILNKRGFRTAQPMLVREELGEEIEKEKAVPYYYIVPYGFTWETDTDRSRLYRLVVMVNAYTGQFEEIVRFHKPVRYLSRNGAISVAAKAMKVSYRKLREAEATLMYRPSEITHIRAYPFWKIALEDKVLYVDQLGAVFKEIKPSVPGD